MTRCANGTTRAAGERPLRRDAARNRERILRAAAEVFTERGLEATLDDVARHAGVGVGTVYRRFPDKESLVGELFQDRIDAMVAVARQACAAPDPGTAFVSYLEYVSATLAGDLGLRQLLMFATYGADRVARARDQMRPVVTELVVRAQEAGRLRADFSASDVPMIAFMLASVAEYAGPARPDLWRRYLAMIADALAPSRTGTALLPAGALSPEDMAQSMRAHSRRSSAGKLPISKSTCRRTFIHTRAITASWRAANRHPLSDTQLRTAA
jgi:AcrR family transcriptional regulator